jgi:hypothetical protein
MFFYCQADKPGHSTVGFLKAFLHDTIHLMKQMLHQIIAAAQLVLSHEAAFARELSIPHCGTSFAILSAILDRGKVFMYRIRKFQVKGVCIL